MCMWLLQLVTTARVTVTAAVATAVVSLAITVDFPGRSQKSDTYNSVGENPYSTNPTHHRDGGGNCVELCFAPPGVLLL